VRIETERLLIRDVETGDAAAFAEMAADGSLGRDIGFDRDCGGWLTGWTAEAKRFAARDRPDMDYLAYTVALKGENTVVGSVGCSYYEDLGKTGITYFIGGKHRNKGYALEAVKGYIEYFFRHYPAEMMAAVIRDENITSWKTAAKAGFTLIEKKLYRDMNDDQEELYRFYELTRAAALDK